MERNRPWLIAVLAVTFLSFLFLPAYMTWLRNQASRAAPDLWSEVMNNGPFTVVSPLQVTTIATEECGYAIKLRQIALHGVPGDPYLNDRSLKSWVFDCLLFYPLVPLLWLAGGNIQLAWILAHALFGTLWLWAFYRIFHFYSGDARYALLFATGAFFFIDFLLYGMIKIGWGLLINPGRIPGELAPLLAQTTGGPIQFIRMPTPALTFLWMYAGLWGGVRLATAPGRRPRAALLIGLVLGLLALAHFYEWTISVASLFLIWLASPFLRIERWNRWNLGVASVTAGVVSLAYYLVAHSLTHDVMRDIVDRMGMFGVNFRPESFLYLLLAAVTAWQAHRITDRRRWLWIVGTANLVAVFLVTNLSLVLRHDIQFFHAGTVANLGTVLLLLCWLIDRRAIRAFVRPHSIVLVLAILAWVLLREKAWGDDHFRLFGIPRDMAAATDWIDENLPAESPVVTLSQPIVELLALRTHVTSPVTCGMPNFSAPISTSENLRALARTLSALDVDVRPLSRGPLGRPRRPAADAERFPGRPRLGVPAARLVELLHDGLEGPAGPRGRGDRPDPGLRRERAAAEKAVPLLAAGR